jgi:ketosteroid isomerase-like protein/quercetin dioxygenase-like cupin family protein
MRRCLCVLGMVALSVAGCGRSVDVEQERMALLEADRQWSQAATDLDLFMSYYTSDATSYPPGMPALVGPDAIRKTFTEMYSVPGFSLSWTADKAEVSASGDVGYTTGTYDLTMGGVKDSGKYITLWRKQPEGTWKVTADIFNSNLPPGGPSAQHVMVAPAAIKWGAGPPSLPPGVEIAVISGDPSQAQPFVIRGRFPAGWRVPLHWHPTTEHITVLSGTVALGMDGGGDQELAAGGFAVVPAEMRHTFVARTAGMIQVHGMGPFAVNYVNPADDPSKK